MRSQLSLGVSGTLDSIEGTYIMKAPRICVLFAAVALMACDSRPAVRERAPAGGGTASIDSADAATVALIVVENNAQKAATETRNGYQVSRVTRDGADYLVVVVPVCDTGSQVGCGGGDVTVRVSPSGTATIVARGQ